MYKVLIREVETGEELLCRMDLEWRESSIFWWTEGNYACDCNRGDTFDREKGIDSDHECSDGKYMAIKAVFSDGSEVALDET